MKAFLLASATLLLAAPAYAQEAETITFATFGDYGDGPGATAVASLVKRNNVDYIVTAGDNCYDLSPIAEQVGKNYGEYTMREGPLESFDADSNMPLPEGRWRRSAQVLWFQARRRLNRAVEDRCIPRGSGQFARAPVLRMHAVALRGMGVFREDNTGGRQLPYFVSGLGRQSIREFGAPVEGSVVRYTGQYGALFTTATATAVSFEFRTIDGRVVDSCSMVKADTTQPPPEPPEPETPPPTDPGTRSTSATTHYRPPWAPKQCCSFAPDALARPVSRSTFQSRASLELINAKPARTRPAFWAQQHSVIAKTHCHSVYLEDTFANSISRGWA